MGTGVDLGVQNSRVRLLWIMNQKSPQNVVEAIVFILSDGEKIVSSHQTLLIHALGNFKPTAGQLNLNRQSSSMRETLLNKDFLNS